MEFRFYIQDPTHSKTTYLYEAILAAVDGASRWRGVYAFASQDGVDQLIDDPAIHEYMGAGGEIDLLVGIDAVTNRPTLERLRELEQCNPKFRPKVFWNGSRGLFHPKISDFVYEDGRRTLIVGSGNLTPGGLMNNFEGYTVVSADGTERLDTSALDHFFDRHVDNIRSIEEEALERAARNLVRPIHNARRHSSIAMPRPRRVAEPIPRPGPVRGFARVLVARVPAAGGRWAQVHFNADVVRDYFRITNHQTQRVYLTQVHANGGREEVEVRPCVFSQTNRNHKIEIGAAKGQAYPQREPPILVFREHQLRTFDYMLVMPGDRGYGSLMAITEELPSLGRGFRRVMTDMNRLAASWFDCPLLALDVNEQEI